ncbi:MAG: cytochrome b N-terminal domain-containing protein [Gemmatimonadaceae bacterium]|nr:cytochrome b N-terminal domain-containing protein [Gemmatimonadaceae bacterium]
MAISARPAERLALRALNVADGAAARLYGSRWNPLHQSGAIAVALLGVLIVTGLWLLLFYRVGAPYDSVARITADPWVGRWTRGVHRFASDWVIVAVAVHGLRMFAQARSWGPRVIAWVSGVFLVALLYLCGLTGYVMVWDAFGYQVAHEGARLLDSLPILSEPISRAFAGDESLLGPFFFLNLFAHIAIPLGMGLLFWLHVSRLARPTMFPPRRVTIVIVGLLVGAAVLWPLGMQPEANPFRLPASVETDIFYGFWLPLTTRLPAGVALTLLAASGAALTLVPMLTRRRGTAVPPPSVVDESVCTGCTQCAIDCPFDAITMIPREPAGRSLEMARVDPDRCVSCGICAGSCAPMAVGPAGRTGRDQLAEIRAFLAEGQVPRGAPVVVCCARSARGWGAQLEARGATLHPVDCAGSVHTSVIEFLVRGGAGGVLVLTCPPRDCWNREGPTWVVERMYHDREAELKPRVDRRRVGVADAGATDPAAAIAAFEQFAARLAALDDAPVEVVVEIEMECEPVPAQEDA